MAPAFNVLLCGVLFVSRSSLSFSWPLAHHAWSKVLYVGVESKTGFPLLYPLSSCTGARFSSCFRWVLSRGLFSRLPFAIIRQFLFYKYVCGIKQRGLGDPCAFSFPDSLLCCSLSCTCADGMIGGSSQEGEGAPFLCFFCGVERQLVVHPA